MNNKDHEILKRFKPGAILHASDLNHINDVLHHIAKKNNIHLRSRSSWKLGEILTANALNNLSTDVEKVFEELGLGKISWSFGKFKDGTVLKAEYLNEIVDRIQQCINKAD